MVWQLKRAGSEKVRNGGYGNPGNFEYLLPSTFSALVHTTTEAWHSKRFRFFFKMVVWNTFWMTCKWNDIRYCALTFHTINYVELDRLDYERIRETGVWKKPFFLDKHMAPILLRAPHCLFVRQYIGLLSKRNIPHFCRETWFLD